MTTFYEYDDLNRLTVKTYTDGTPRVRYVYDTMFKGRLSSAATLDAASGNLLTDTSFTYDNLGRVKTSTPDVFGLASLSDGFVYEYDTADHLVSVTYPSQRKVAYCYDVAGRTGKVAGTAPSTTVYASGPESQGHIRYASNGGLKTLALGNGVTETTGYNDRLQPASVAATKNSSTLLSLTYGYTKTTGCNGATGSCNNGNVYQQTIASDSWSVTQSYEYDSLNRLLWAQEGSSPNGWRRQYGYDAFGNRWVVDPYPSLTFGIALSPRTPIGTQTSSTAFGSNNRLTIAGFDPAGNQTDHLPWTIAYDAENRQKTATQTISGTTYGHLYDYACRRFKLT